MFSWYTFNALVFCRWFSEIRSIYMVINTHFVFLLNQNGGSFGFSCTLPPYGKATQMIINKRNMLLQAFSVKQKLGSL